jgi:urease accessory protein
LHPLVGVDHLLAMLGVGLWAGQRGGRALWLAPSVFLAVLAIGGALGMAGITLPWVEPGIVASVLVVGVLVAAAVPMPLGLGVGLMGLFALVHGHAHGAEAPVDASGAAYAAGFLAASALLVGAGIALARGLERGGRPAIVRACGAAVALGGAMLCIA